MILRSTKAVRLAAGLARSSIYNGHQETTEPIRLLSTTFVQRLTSTIQQPDGNRSINKLDEEFRRTGRITRRDIENGLDEVRHNGTASSAQSLLLIRCCGNLVPDELPQSRMAFVHEVWHTLNSLNVPMDTSHYNELLKVYVENEHSFHPIEFMVHMDSKGVEPNRVTYQRIISKYCQDGDIDGATKVVEFMREEKLPINEQVFNALITGHSEADDVKSAVEILSVMKQAGLEPTSDTYTHLLCAYAKHGMKDKISSTLDECESNEIHLSDKDLFKIIYKLATNGHSDYVEHIIPRLRKLTGYSKHVENLILRLTMKNGQEDLALKILKTIPAATRRDGETSDVGAFFIKHLIKSRHPTEKILSICRELQQIGLNSRATLIAAEAAAKSGDIDVALPFFKELKENGLPLRQDYFWPLISEQAKVGTDAILDVLCVMQSELGMTVNGNTVRDYVIPNLKERNYEKIILKLQTSAVPKPIAVTSCVCHALQNNRIHAAAALASSFGIYYQPSLLRRPLVDALVKTNDFRSWVSIVRSVYENLPRLQKIQSAVGNEQIDDTENQMQSEVVGMFVVDAVTNLHERLAEITQIILSALVEQGLSLSQADAERIKRCFGSSPLTPKMSFLLQKLTSGTLQPVPYKSTPKQFNFSDIMSNERLTELIQQAEAEGEYTKGLQWALLQSHLKGNDVQKTEELIEKLLKSGFRLTIPDYSQLIEFYCTNDQLDKSLALYADVKSRETDFVLDDVKTIKIVHGLVTNDRIDEAVEFIGSGRGHQKLRDDLLAQYNSMCWRLMNHLAEKGRDADLTRVFNALEENNFIKVNDMVLALLIKVHLVNNNVTKALTSFEFISTKYNCTPWKNELACTFIQLKDATSLQLLVDLSTKVHGEVNSLYDLVFSFIECGCKEQARRILETPVLHSRPEALINACERYRRERKTASLALETLVQATSDIRNVDRNEVYYNLLLAYCKEDSPIKALNLWTKIRKGKDEVDDKFLSTLARFLNEKGIKIPFEVPAKVKSDILDSTIKAKKHLSTAPSATKEVNVNKLKMLLKKNQLDSATQHILETLESNTYPSPQAFRLYLNNMASAGQYQVFEQLSPRLSVEFKQKVLFDDRLGRAYVSAGKAELFFDQAIQNCNNATTEEELKLAFPSGAIRGILGGHPELMGKFEKFAEDMTARQFLVPIKIIWSHHIENGKLDEADRIMKNYLHESPTDLFNSLLRTALQRNDEKIPLNLLNALSDKNLSQNDLVAIHNCLIDVYCSQEKFDEALNAIESAMIDVSLENIKRRTLVSVKDGLESEGKIFPHKIPDKEKLNASGGVRRNNSSDDELRGKWDEFKQILANIFEENVKI